MPPFRLRKSRRFTRAAAQAIAAQRVDPGDRLRRSSAGKAGSSYEISKSEQAPGEDACPPGCRGWAKAQWPAHPGGRSSPSRHDGREGHGQVFPPVNELVDLNVHLLAGRRCAESGRVQVGDVGRALHGRRAHAEDPYNVTHYFVDGVTV